MAGRLAPTNGGSMAKRMKLRRAGDCADCGVGIEPGSDGYWFASEKVVRCVSCVGRGDAEPAGTEEPALVGAPGPVEDVAGASAQREYARRAERNRKKHEAAVVADAEWRATLIEKRPVVGRIASALTAKPELSEKQHTTAWKVGAEGERRVAEVLAPVEGIEVLHDRLVPQSKANIDHIAVAPGGVFVVDAKKYAGPIEIRDVGNFFKPDHRLYVKGRDRTKLVDSMLWQMDIVRQVLGIEFADVPVQGVLCFVGAEWGFRKKPKVLNGVTSLWPLALPDHVTKAGPHSDDIAAIARHLRSQLKAA